MKLSTRYVLVFQLEETFFESPAALVDFEERLRATLPRTCTVDGHELGAGTTNFIVRTGSPVAAHERFRRRMSTRAMERKLRVSFRLESGDDWMNLWPRRDARPFALGYPRDASPFCPTSKRAIPKRSKIGVSKVVTRARRA